MVRKIEATMHDGQRVVTLADARINAAEVIQVIRVEFLRGAGIEDDPIRRVVQYWSLDGHRLVEDDPDLSDPGGADAE